MCLFAECVASVAGRSPITMGGMDLARVTSLAQGLLDGRLSFDDFVREVARPAIADVGPAQLDLDRQRRCGYPEVVFGQGKSVASLERIFDRLVADGVDVFATRLSGKKAKALLPRYQLARYNRLARTLRIPPAESTRSVGATKDACATDQGRIAIVTAGTSDLPVAEEARETALWMGVDVRFVQDVGVAGPHRFPARLGELAGCDAVVVVAGMEGALPSVVGGYLSCPVVAVPTSVGYGASLGGMAALLGMLNSCASNVTVVNIDAGFKGAYVAGLIASRAAEARRSGRSS